MNSPLFKVTKISEQGLATENCETIGTTDEKDDVNTATYPSTTSAVHTTMTNPSTAIQVTTIQQITPIRCIPRLILF